MGKNVSTVVINPNKGVSYINEHIRNAGFTGELDYILTATTLVILRPGAIPDDVIEGLTQTIKNVKLKAKYAGNSTG